MRPLDWRPPSRLWAAWRIAGLASVYGWVPRCSTLGHRLGCSGGWTDYVAQAWCESHGKG